MWITTNYKGETVTWYSEEEYTILEQENQEAKEIIAELKQKVKDLDKMTGIFSVRLAKKYEQALTEIREIVSDEIDKTDSDDELMQIYGTIYNRCNEGLKWKINFSLPLKDVKI